MGVTHGNLGVNLNERLDPRQAANVNIHNFPESNGRPEWSDVERRGAMGAGACHLETLRQEERGETATQASTCTTNKQKINLIIA